MLAPPSELPVFPETFPEASPFCALGPFITGLVGVALFTVPVAPEEAVTVVVTVNSVEVTVIVPELMSEPEPPEHFKK